jgi:WD40 repeat protein
LNDKKTLVSAAIDQSLRVLDAESGELDRSLDQHTGPVHALALRPAHKGLPMLASAAGDRSVRIWQPTIGRMIRYARLESAP